MPALHALGFLEKQPAEPIPAVCALFGDEPFLKSLVIARLPPAPAYTPCATLKTACTQSIRIADALASNVTGSEAPRASVLRTTTAEGAPCSSQASSL